ncbi:phage terminase large subunit [Collimonas humicola]|uniref:phage terminase large subunit n=1 Tax=Collimonas humicola TaxID=2825886 RepID=UPI001E6354BA|nr:phage terminase large subunit [Collimonas humicola]
MTTNALPIGTDTERAVWASMARNSLHFYTKYTFARRKGYKWKDNWHHKVICDALEDVFYGRCKRLIINVPPRYSKTEIAVLNFISWSLGKVPDSEFIHVSYSSTLAENNSANTQGQVSHDCYAEIFPDTKLASSAKAHWKTTAGGVVYATGAGGTITGFGAGKLRDGFAGAIIIDDPHKASEASSDTARQSVIDWYPTTLASRTNNPDTPIIVIMQRLHEEDLSGWLIGGGSGEEWRVLNIPAINDKDEALWPWKHSIETLRQMERSSPYVFAGQYMQRPAPLGGGIFKTAWWSWYNPAAAPKFKRIIQSWDTAFKNKEANDYSVCTTWGETDLGYYLIDIWKDKLEFPDLKRMVVSLATKYKPNALLVEDKASGQSLIQDLRRETRLPIIACGKTTDKVACANLVTPLIEAGRVFLPEGHAEVAGYVHSHSQFPNGAHDDDVDSTTQALTYMSRNQPMARIKIGGA